MIPETKMALTERGFEITAADYTITNWNNTPRNCRNCGEPLPRRGARLRYYCRKCATTRRNIKNWRSKK